MRELLLLALAGVAVLSNGCNPVCSFRSTINAPESLSMRKSLLKKGMGDFCSQMLTRSASLRLSTDSPVIGRFFPTSCNASDNDQGIYVQFGGFGYAWTNVTKKMSFTVGAAAQYKYDFTVPDDGPCDIYAYFRPQRVDASDFKIVKIESQIAQTLNAMTSFGDGFGKQLVGKKLQDGFTVISYNADTSNIDFGLGIIPKGQKPFHPYDAHGADKSTVENERNEIHQNQRDFVPIQVTDNGRAIFTTATVDGAPAIDVIVVRKEDGDVALRQYFETGTAGPLVGTPIASDVLQTGTEMKRAVPVPPGMYYVIFDNTPTAGRVAPPVNALDDRAAVVNYLVQVGDAS